MPNQGRDRLTDTTCKAARAKAKPYRLSDGGGLALEVRTTGTKRWVCFYRPPDRPGASQRKGLGIYPQVSLAEARRKRDGVKALLARGVDPVKVERDEKAEAENVLTLEAMAREWFAHRAGSRDAASEARNARRLAMHVFPTLGRRSVRDLAPRDLVDVLLQIEAAGGIDTAHKVRNMLAGIAAFCVQRHRTNDFASGLRGLLKPKPKKHHAAATTPEAVKGILAKIDTYTGTPTVRAALRLAPLLFVRPGMLRTMLWSELNLRAAEWRTVASKTETDLFVPLAPQAIAIIESLRPLNGASPFVFRSELSEDKPISDMTLGKALRSLGIDTRTEHTTHGWRATARTLLVEELGQREAWVEMQLGHRVGDAHGRAYNRTQWLSERRAMMSLWASYLDALRECDDVREARDRVLSIA